MKLVINSCKNLSKRANNGDERCRTNRITVPVKAVAVQVKSYRLTNNNQRYHQHIYRLHARAVKKRIVRISNILSMLISNLIQMYSNQNILIAKTAVIQYLSRFHKNLCMSMFLKMYVRWANMIVWRQRYRSAQLDHRSRPLNVMPMEINATTALQRWQRKRRATTLLEHWMEWKHQRLAKRRARRRAWRNRRNGRSTLAMRSATMTSMTMNWWPRSFAQWKKPIHRMVCAWFVCRNQKMVLLFTIAFYTYAVAIDVQSKYGTKESDAQSVIHRLKLFWKCSCTNALCTGVHMHFAVFFFFN